MKVGYCVPVVPTMASYRLRVGIPMRNLGCAAVIGPGDVCFFYKHQAGDIDKAIDALHRDRPVVYDVVNDHFAGPLGQHYAQMCDLAGTITVASWAMGERVKHLTGRECVIIDDPYETPEASPWCEGNGLLWFGHSLNLRSLMPHLDAIENSGAELVVCSNIAKASVQWSLENEALCLERAAVVLMTGTNPGASSNRLVKALRAGRFVIAPDDCAESWRAFAPYIWIGNVSDGIEWAFDNREDACRKILAGQEYIRDRFSPWTIGQRWRKLFDSTLALGINMRPDG